MCGEIIVKVADKDNPDNSAQCLIEDELIIGRENGNFIFRDNIYLLPKNWKIKRVGDDLYFYDIPHKSFKNPSRLNAIPIEADRLYPLESGDEVSVESKTYIITYWFSNPEEIELKKTHPFVETCIKMYKVNKDNDMAVYMVFSALATEDVYLPVTNEGALVSLMLNNGSDIIPIFTRSTHLGENEPVNLYRCKIVNCLDKLLKARKNMIINPFSDESIQLVLPYETLEKMLIPAIEHEYTVHKEE